MKPMMLKTLLILFIIVAIALLAFGASAADQSSGNFEALIAALIKLPAPPPPLPETKEQPKSADAEIEEEEPPPTESMPPAQVLKYYEHFTSEGIEREAANGSLKIKFNLLKGLERDPEKLPHLLPLMPQNKEAQARIKRLLDRELKSPRYPAEWRKKVTQYLMYQGSYFREDLIALARNAHDEPAGFELVQGVNDLEGLAKLDWPAAQTLLQTHAAGKSFRIAAVALSTLYKHAISENTLAQIEKYRSQLKALAEDRNAPGYARDRAVNSLLNMPWSGKEDWFKSLFSDSTLMQLIDGSRGYAPLRDFVLSDTDRWIPIVVSMLGNSNRSIHDNAVSCLIQFQNRFARRDALLPLLPWLSIPEWSSARDRFRLIQSMGFIDMPESIPGLIHSGRRSLKCWP
jgi:hypothetical protein